MLNSLASDGHGVAEVYCGSQKAWGLLISLCEVWSLQGSEGVEEGHKPGL